MNLKLVLPLPVSINDLYINEYKWNPKSKKREPTGRRIMSKEGERVKKEIQHAATEQLNGQNWEYNYTLDNFIYMDTNIFFNRMGRDDNNIYKLLPDSLEKIVYDNDSRVLIRTQMILFDSNNPRVEVEFSPVKYIGIFKTQNLLNDFEDKCRECKRYARNCSILRKAKEGRIQDEIVEFVCTKYK
ncbi:RusA family crossover junction endodeoxyribonuclease [Paenibacillus sp. N1-5-1-14]|uniref:RusA family crossover junction endodeoxyribonuclease n=1 Tax=Paenibacillus radicibacter TaxID=2972488 RepID=UPI00215957FD|nr:RusA family crossover junction endodeoxyribonuclease [Paenibacillus radicibacter]MCR8641364.1 RusA family crossover junction endodeoxyribonuclease [Paenibacillus radicibacter]